jgi:hypothetical protein
LRHRTVATVTARWAICHWLSHFILTTALREGISLHYAGVGVEAHRIYLVYLRSLFWWLEVKDCLPGGLICDPGRPKKQCGTMGRFDTLYYPPPLG